MAMIIPKKRVISCNEITPDVYSIYLKFNRNGDMGSGQDIILISIDKHPRNRCFQPNIVVFDAKIGRIRNLWPSKLVGIPGLNDLSTFCSEARRLLCILNKSLVMCI